MLPVGTPPLGSGGVVPRRIFGACPSACRRPQRLVRPGPALLGLAGPYHRWRRSMEHWRSAVPLSRYGLVRASCHTFGAYSAAGKRATGLLEFQRPCALFAPRADRNALPAVLRRLGAVQPLLGCQSRLRRVDTHAVRGCEALGSIDSSQPELGWLGYLACEAGQRGTGGRMLSVT